MKNRLYIPLVVLSIISWILFAYFAYQGFLSYQSYKVLQSSDKYLPQLYRGDVLLRALENEAQQSAIYLSQQGKSDFSVLEKARKQTDERVARYKGVLRKIPSFASDLQYVRSRVDLISPDSVEIFSKYYDKSLGSKVLEGVQQGTQELEKIIGLSEEPGQYLSLLAYRNRQTSGKIFIDYLLQKGEMANNGELQNLDAILTPVDSPSSLKIDFGDTPIKAEIINQILTKATPFDSAKWDKNITKQLQKFENVKKDLFVQIRTKVNDAFVDPDRLLFKLLGALLFLLVALFSLKNAHIIGQHYLSYPNLHADDEMPRDARLGKRKPLKKPQSVRDSLSDDQADTAVLKKEIPLSNEIRQKEEESPVHHERTALRAFNPLEKFTKIATILLEESKKKDFSFKYRIDPTIPTHAVSSVSRIDEVFTNVLDELFVILDGDDFLEYSVENVAQKKSESAVRMQLFVSNFKEERTKLNLKRLKTLMHILEGSCELQYSDQGRTLFLIFNLKQ